MNRLREVPVVYGPTKATSEALRTRCVTLGVDFESMRVVEETRVTNNVQGNMTTKGREVMGVLCEDPLEGIAPLALPAEMYDTRAHQELLDALFSKTKSLNNDNFAFMNGVAAFAVPGAVGKVSPIWSMAWLTGALARIWRGYCLIQPGHFSSMAWLTGALARIWGGAATPLPLVLFSPFPCLVG